MNPNNDLKIVRISNISPFDFTAELGAMFNGVPYFVAAGGSLLAPYAIGNHLATALAKQMLIQKAPIRDSNNTDGKGSDRPLWTPDTLDNLKAKIMKEVYEEEAVTPMSPHDVMAKKVKDLNKDQQEDGVTPKDVEVKDPVTYKDKKEVIEALEAKKITFDARKTKVQLEKLLKQKLWRLLKHQTNKQWIV